MHHQGLHIEQQLLDKLQYYLSHGGEESLLEAYKLGRQAVEAGMGELELLNLYNSALQKYNSVRRDNGDKADHLELAVDFLSECLAPYDMRQRGFSDLIRKLNERNQQLQEEITRRSETEEELIRSKDHFQNLIENALDIITVLNHDATVRYESPSIERILGYSPEELIGMDVLQFVHPDDLGMIVRKLNGVVSNPAGMDSAEFRFKRKDGSWCYLESIAKNVVDPMYGPGVIVNSRDVTEKVLARERLERSEKKLAKAQEVGRFGSWEWGIVNDELQWSDEMCRIYGVSPENAPVTYDGYLAFIHPDDRMDASGVVEAAMKSGNSFGFEHRIKRPDGTERVLYGRGEVIEDRNGKPVRMIGTGQDITEIKEAEKKLRHYSEQLQKLTARKEKVREEERVRIAREIHDELGQMLTVLKMDVSLAMDTIKNEYDEKFISIFLTEINHVVNRIDTIVESVQRITSELRPEVLDNLGLVDAIEWQIQEMRKRIGLQFQFSKRINNNIDRLDNESAIAIFRILQETLTNVVRHAEASEVRINLEEEAGFLILTVEDNGKGVTREQLNDVNSLGITGMRERCNSLGGKITFTGDRGSGTKVTLRVPFQGN